MAPNKTTVAAQNLYNCARIPSSHNGPEKATEMRAQDLEVCAKAAEMSAHNCDASFFLVRSEHDKERAAPIFAKVPNAQVRTFGEHLVAIAATHRAQGREDKADTVDIVGLLLDDDLRFHGSDRLIGYFKTRLLELCLIACVCADQVLVCNISGDAELHNSVNWHVTVFDKINIGRHGVGAVYSLLHTHKTRNDVSVCTVTLRMRKGFYVIDGSHDRAPDFFHDFLRNTIQRLFDCLPATLELYNAINFLSGHERYLWEQATDAGDMPYNYGMTPLNGYSSLYLPTKKAFDAVERELRTELAKVMDQKSFKYFELKYYEATLESALKDEEVCTSPLFTGSSFVAHHDGGGYLANTVYQGILDSRHMRHDIIENMRVSYYVHELIMPSIADGYPFRDGLRNILEGKYPPIKRDNVDRAKSLMSLHYYCRHKQRLIEGSACEKPPAPILTDAASYPDLGSYTPDEPSSLLSAITPIVSRSSTQDLSGPHQ
jgi:hypothetical protein